MDYGVFCFYNSEHLGVCEAAGSTTETETRVAGKKVIATAVSSHLKAKLPLAYQLNYLGI